MNHDEMDYIDTELIRARMIGSDLPAKLCMEYLYLLSNLNAILLLLSPSSGGDLDDVAADDLHRLYLEHRQRRLAFEAEYPELIVLSAGTGLN